MLYGKTVASQGGTTARGSAQQQSLLNQKAGSQLNTANQLYGDVTAADKAILANPGFSPAQINTQMSAALTPIAGQVASGNAALARRAAATGNTAGMVAGQRDNVRTGAQLGSQAAWGVQSNADQTALSERDKALANLSSLYGPTLGSADSLYGSATNAMLGRTGNQISLGPLGKFGTS